MKFFLECMERLSEAINFFSENNPDSPELNIVVRNLVFCTKTFRLYLTMLSSFVWLIFSHIIVTGLCLQYCFC